MNTVMSGKKITIARKDGVSIFGRVIDNKGKLGKFEVSSDYWGSDKGIYHHYSQAEDRMNAIIALHNKNKNK